jgi:ATP-dependent RNA helicase DHX37/DHR1
VGDAILIITTEILIAFDFDSDADAITKITPLGCAIASFPVAPRYGKMLSLGHQQNLLPYVVALVAGLSVQEVFIESERRGTEEVSLQTSRYV